MRMCCFRLYKKRAPLHSASQERIRLLLVAGLVQHVAERRPCASVHRQRRRSAHIRRRRRLLTACAHHSTVQQTDVMAYRRHHARHRCRRIQLQILHVQLALSTGHRLQPRRIAVVQFANVLDGVHVGERLAVGQFAGVLPDDRLELLLNGRTVRVAVDLHTRWAGMGGAADETCQHLSA